MSMDSEDDRMFVIIIITIVVFGIVVDYGRYMVFDKEFIRMKKLWIARDACGALCAYSKKPVKRNDAWIVDCAGEYASLEDSWFPEVE